MSLPSPGRFAKANKLLQSLDLNSLTRELSKPSPEERSIRERFLDVERSLSLSLVAHITQPLPLHLTLSSVVAKLFMGQDIIVNTLVAKAYDPTSRIHHLCNNLAIVFAAAGLYNIFIDKVPHRIILKTMGRPLLGVPLIRTEVLRPETYIPSPTQTGKMQRKDPPVIDSRDLVRIFKDFVWADKIRLERLSICPPGLTKHVRQAGSDA